MTDTSISKQKAGTGIFSQIKKQQVILTAGFCLIVLAVVLKNVLFVPSDILMRDMIVYIIIYLGFITFAFRTDDVPDKSGNISPLAGDLLVVTITLAIIAAYAL
jgi:hypothetical protein